MKERPILMNGDMVRAVLDGRKTQTRRMMRVQPIGDDDFIKEIYERNMPAAHSCPFGKPGDRLYVREAFGFEVRSIGGTPHQKITYRASNPDAVHCYDCNGMNMPMKWTPSIHMPRWASRILLEIVSVSVERLQDIAPHDAISEGFDKSENEFPTRSHYVNSAIRWFKDLWESINGPGSWEANPWVWVVEFKVIKQ